MEYISLTCIKRYNMETKYYTITALNKAIKNMFDEKRELNNIHLKGEISNFKHHSRGHLYFTLKDENSQLSAIMFASQAQSLKFEPADGMKVLVSGKVSVYESSGTYQIYVNDMMEDGLGNLYLEFEKLKKKLEQEGLFKKEYKKPIPKFPMKIGIITAPTGAAIKDIMSTLKRRFPIAETILFPSLVQGVDAKDDIVRNIKLANTYPLDVIILGRGGGSIEDLWAFNEECVARAIFDSVIPIISGVGHEIDFTISDFVADLRAPTPTGAAELCVPNKDDVIELFNQYNIRLTKAIHNYVDRLYEQLNNLKNSYILKNPSSLYEKSEQYFDNLYERLLIAIKSNIDKNKDRLNTIKSSYVIKNPNMLFIDKAYNYNDLVKRLKNSINMVLDNNKNNYINLLSKLEVLNPITTLKRGYSVTRFNDKIITKRNDVKKGDIIITSISDGNIESVVEKVYEKC